MERGMLGNWHVPCGVGEKLEITSNAYLLLTFSSTRSKIFLKDGTFKKMLKKVFSVKMKNY